MGITSVNRGLRSLPVQSAQQRVAGERHTRSLLGWYKPPVGGRAFGRSALRKLYVVGAVCRKKLEVVEALAAVKVMFAKTHIQVSALRQPEIGTAGFELHRTVAALSVFAHQLNLRDRVQQISLQMDDLEVVGTDPCPPF